MTTARNSTTIAGTNGDGGLALTNSQIESMCPDRGAVLGHSMTHRQEGQLKANDTARATAQLWTAEDTAAYLGVPVKTLYQWKWRRQGPPVRRVGRFLRYDPDEVKTWFRSLDSNDAA